MKITRWAIVGLIVFDIIATIAVFFMLSSRAKAHELEARGPDFLVEYGTQTNEYPYTGLLKVYHLKTGKCFLTKRNTSSPLTEVSSEICK